jgi:ribosomal protein S12 methylthiotransferase accessory factor
MELLGDRYIISTRNIKRHKSYLIKNILNNKGIHLSDNENFEVNRCLVMEELFKSHKCLCQELGMDQPVFYECLIYDLQIYKHPLPEFEKDEVDLYGENEVNEVHRVRSKIDIEKILSSIFDNKYGVVFNVYNDIHSVEYAVVGAEISPVAKQKVTEIGFGRAMNFKEAKVEAVLEALERYTMFQIDNETRLFKLVDVLKNEYHRVEFEEFLNRECYCIEGKRLGTDEEVWLPMQFCNYVNKDGFKLVSETSNGMALGASKYEATLYALLEFIERDAFLIFWHKKILLNRIDPESIDEEAKKVMESFETDGKKVYLFDMSIDIRIPVVLALVISPDIKPCTYLSSAAHLNYHKAVNNALKEAVVAHNIYSKNPNVGKKYKNKYEVVDLPDHYNYYARPEKIKTYDFLLNSNEKFAVEDLYEKTSFKSDKEALKYLLNRMSHIKDIFCLELLNKAINDVGFSVVKMIIPEMQPMYFGQSNKRINISRMENAIKNSSYRNAVLMEEGYYNDEPHPFP